VLAGMRRTVGRWLTRLGVGDEDRFDITVATSEAAGNAIEHAYGPSDATFSVGCDYALGTVRVTVTDCGSWRTVASREAGRGRGMLIMHELMDEVNVARGDWGTRVVLSKRVEPTR
jgi:anti-sigma regulatory factor (Ser/Thr protein kinase)